jgi:hypothetical protein
MKEQHTEGERVNARAVLAAANVALGQNFFTLRQAQVDVILAEADRVRYHKPKSANGSRGRYFYALLQKRAK